MRHDTLQTACGQYQHLDACMKAETEYCHNVLENTEHLQEQLYREMRGRIQEADQSAPVRSEPQQGTS